METGYAAYEVENIGSTRVIFVETEDTISKIAEISNNQNWIRDAPAVLVMCSDTKLHKKIHTKKDAEIFSIQNCSMISQNILLSASEFNLAGAIINNFDEKKLPVGQREIDDAHEHYKPIQFVPVILPVSYYS